MKYRRDSLQLSITTCLCSQRSFSLSTANVGISNKPITTIICPLQISEVSASTKSCNYSSHENYWESWMETFLFHLKRTAVPVNVALANTETRISIMQTMKIVNIIVAAEFTFNLPQNIEAKTLLLMYLNCVGFFFFAVNCHMLQSQNSHYAKLHNSMCNR